MVTSPEQRKKNLRLALILASVALAFGLGGRGAAGRVTDRWASQYLDRKPPSGM